MARRPLGCWPSWSPCRPTGGDGRELALRLEVDGRTVRRYVAALQDIGIPLRGSEASTAPTHAPGLQAAAHDVHRRRSGRLVLGLLAARRFGLDTEGAAADDALAKIHRVLPTRLRSRVEALETALGFTTAIGAAAPVPGETVLLLADAIRRGKRVRTGYRTFSGETSDRDLSPYGLVFHAGRWYLPAHDHGRGELRTFRVDRMREPTLGEAAWHAPPDDFDAVASVTAAIASVPWTWAVEVALDLPLAVAAERVPSTLGSLREDGGGTVLTMRVESLDWMATVLAGLGCGFTVRRPDELRKSVAALAARLAEAVS